MSNLQPQIEIIAPRPTDAARYLDPLCSLVERAQQGDASPYLYPNGPAFYQRNLAGATLNLLALAGVQVVGYAALRMMSPWPDYFDPPKHPPEQCALMLLNLVDPAFRGQGLGQQLAEARIELAKAQGIKHLFVTVHPDNRASVRVLARQGFRLIAQKPMFTERLLRNLMQLDL